MRYTKLGMPALLTLAIAALPACGDCTSGAAAPAPPVRTEARSTPPETVVAQVPEWTEVDGVEPPLPGVEAPSEALAATLADCLRAKGTGYLPRAEHRHDDGTPTYTNRLICETSPYLLQHAHNPVNWYPWGDEAFERARERDVPVLLSVGYSTCHWCHVMERESFEDMAIAAYMNAHFVSIKVDREERPDVDDTYMTAVNLMVGRGGWPMTVVLTPARQPFFGGTYFPPRGTDRRPGFFEILEELSARYRDDREAVVADAAQLSQRIALATRPAPPGDVPGPEAIHTAAHRLAGSFDPVFGGFGGSPKFPRPVTLELLLRYHRRTGDEAALRMVTLTLEQMARGGMYDHVGGGFHRYSTDARWLVPHFEKMLYDNAQLAVTYLEAWQVTGHDALRRVARETLDYIAREMTHPDGGFYSATDADSVNPDGEMEEGWSFTWTEAELDDVLGADDGRVVRAWYGTSRRGNFEGRNILNTPRSETDVAESLGIDVATLVETVERARPRLRAVRDTRPPPHLDDKVITAWNGLMISAFARAAFALDDEGYLATARGAAAFVMARMRLDDGRLLRTWRDGLARQGAFLDDYAFFIAGLLDLFEADGDPRWLREAIALQATLDADFWDDAGGGYFATAHAAEEMLARPRPDYDGAEPSGNSVALLNLLRLGELTLDASYRERAERGLAAFASTLSTRGTSAPLMLAALDFYLDTAREIVLVEPSGEPATDVLLDARRTRFLPSAVTVVIREDAVAALLETVPLVEYKIAQDGQTTAYVCEQGRCERPTSDAAVFARQLAVTTSLFEDDSRRRALTIPEPAPPPQPWEYDPVANRHWDPAHQHWHDGPPPSQ